MPLHSEGVETLLLKYLGLPTPPLLHLPTMVCVVTFHTHTHTRERKRAMPYLSFRFIISCGNKTKTHYHLLCNDCLSALVKLNSRQNDPKNLRSSKDEWKEVIFGTLRHDASEKSHHREKGFMQKKFTTTTTQKIWQNRYGIGAIYAHSLSFSTPFPLSLSLKFSHLNLCKESKNSAIQKICTCAFIAFVPISL